MAEITKQDLIDFETEICNLFCEAKIKAPIHLSDGNEEQLIEIFRKMGDCWIIKDIEI